MAYPSGQLGKLKKALGHERFNAICNLLAKGDSTTKIARVIQQDWEEYTHVTEPSLIRQLNRIRPALMHNSAMIVAALPEEDRLQLVAKLEGSVDVLAELEWIVKEQKARIVMSRAREEKLNLAFHGLTKDISLYRELLLTLAAHQFNIGVLDYSEQVLRMKNGSKMKVAVDDDGKIKEVTLEDVVSEAQQVLEGVFINMGLGERVGEVADVTSISKPAN